MTTWCTTTSWWNTRKVPLPAGTTLVSTFIVMAESVTRTTALLGPALLPELDGAHAETARAAISPRLGTSDLRICSSIVRDVADLSRHPRVFTGLAGVADEGMARSALRQRRNVTSLRAQRPESPSTEALPRGPLEARSPLCHERGRLGAPREAELVEDAAHVVLDRLLRQEQGLADLAVRLSLGQLLEHLALLFGKRREHGVLVAALAHALEHLPGHVGIKERTARGHRGDRVDHRLPTRLLEQVARGTGHDRREQRLVVGVGGEHDHPRFRAGLPDRAAGFDAAAVGQAHVITVDAGLPLRPAPTPPAHGPASAATLI